MAADGNMRSSMVTSGAHLLSTENRLSTKKNCFLLSLPFQIEEGRRLSGDPCAENGLQGDSVNYAEHGSVGNRQ